MASVNCWRPDPELAGIGSGIEKSTGSQPGAERSGHAWKSSSSHSLQSRSTMSFYSVKGPKLFEFNASAPLPKTVQWLPPRPPRITRHVDEVSPAASETPVGGIALAL